jgi:hypothetical protein
MKAVILQILLMFLMGYMTSFADQNYDTTAKLPNDVQIWPIPELEVTGDIITVKAEFIEAKIILRVTQGNKTTNTYLIRYKVIKHDGRYPYDELTFIALDGWPAKGSGIIVQKLPWPFEKGEKFFYLKKDGDCKYKAYFDILSYS